MEMYIDDMIIKLKNLDLEATLNTLQKFWNGAKCQKVCFWSISGQNLWAS